MASQKGKRTTTLDYQTHAATEVSTGNQSGGTVSIPRAFARCLCCQRKSSSAALPSSNWPVTYSPIAGPCLNPCPEAAAANHTFPFPDAVNQKIPIRSVFVLADARFTSARCARRKPRATYFRTSPSSGEEISIVCQDQCSHARQMQSSVTALPR